MINICKYTVVTLKKTISAISIWVVLLYKETTQTLTLFLSILIIDMIACALIAALKRVNICLFNKEWSIGACKFALQRQVC